MKIFRPRAKVFSDKRRNSSDAVHIGKAAVSIAGHDKGKFFIVVEAVGGGCINVADGKFRTLSAPKKKNLRHIEFTGDTLPPELISGGRIKATDKDISEFLEKTFGAEDKQKLNCVHTEP